MAEPPNMAVSVRLQHRDLNGTTADIRHDRRIGRIPKYVDQDRSYLNSEILRGPTPHTMRAECMKLRELTPKQRKMRSDAAVSSRMIITFGKGLQPHFEALDVALQDQIYTEIANAVADRLSTSLLALVAHRDETAPHAHGQMLAVNKYGVPVSKVATPTVMSELQDIAHEIALKYLPMCERGTKKADRIKRGDDPSKIYNRSVKQLHTDIPKEIEAKQAELDAIASQIPTLTARVAEMQARVDKLENEEKQRELTTAKVKRLRTYRSRLTDRIGDLREARAERNRLTAEIEEKQKLITELESRADQAEQRAARAAERAQAAKQATEAEEGRKSEAEASVAALGVEKAALVAEVSDLTDARDQLQPEVTFLQSKKEKLSARAQEAEAEAAEARKQASEAQLEARALLSQKNEAQASVDTLRDQENEIRLNAQKLLAAQKKITGDFETLKQSVQTETERNQTLKADNAALRRQSQALESKIGDVRESLEFLRPALAAADFLQQVSVLDPSEQDSAWDMVTTPPRECDPVEYASALRMIDPLFAPEITVPRSTIADENLETLHECAEEDYWAIVDAVRAEEGAESGIEALAEGAVYLDKAGTIAPSDPDQGPSGLFAKALGWVRNTFEGVKRGAGLALAATRDGISAELSAARANLFNAFEPKLQSALRHLLKAETGHKSFERERPDLEHDPSDDFEP